MDDNSNLNKSLKTIVIVLSTLIIMVLILLAVVLLKKKTASAITSKEITNPSVFKTINLQKNLLPPNCTPFEVIFKENYIAVYSKKCNIIKIFHTS